MTSATRFSASAGWLNSEVSQTAKKMAPTARIRNSISGIGPTLAFDPLCGEEVSVCDLPHICEAGWTLPAARLLVRERCAVLFMRRASRDREKVEKSFCLDLFYFFLEFEFKSGRASRS